ncbi:MAG: hypothetical protein RJB01_1249 [Actinomycetota bacterium]
MNARVYSPAHPFATAVLIQNGTIAWVGDDSGAETHRELASRVIDAGGGFLCPGFVDSHVHATHTGLLHSGLNLTECTSARELLESIARACKDHPSRRILGHGWDETRWDSPELPRLSEIDEAAAGCEVYVSRIDVHSALVSSALLSRCSNLKGVRGWSPNSALVDREAHAIVREVTTSSIDPVERAAAQRAYRSLASRQGIVSIHEMAGPAISSEADALALREISTAEPGPLLYTYWGQTAHSGGLDVAQEIGAIGLAGDLFIDGAIGSRTAALHQPYSDCVETTGATYLGVDEITAHLITCTELGIPGGFHVIGDAACEAAVTGISAAVQMLGVERVRNARHRLEHAELLTKGSFTLLAEAGVALGMQPLFDRYWGNPGGMYETRLGQERAHSMNRWGSAHSAGVPLTFSSDSPVTETSPWAAMRAAMWHHNEQERLSARASFAAHTRGGWRVVGDFTAGVIDVGAPAHLALWDAPEFSVQHPDQRVAAWSTDPRSGVPPLPSLEIDGELPRCISTWVLGAQTYSDGTVTEAVGEP